MEPTSQPTEQNRFIAFCLGILAFARATSYWFRPPQLGSSTADTIFAVLSPQAWVLILFLVGVTMLVGSIKRWIIPLYLGSFVGLLCYAVFSYNLIPPVIADPKKAWNGIGELLMMATLHGLLMWNLGPHFRSSARRR